MKATLEKAKTTLSEDNSRQDKLDFLKNIRPAGHEGEHDSFLLQLILILL